MNHSLIHYIHALLTPEHSLRHLKDLLLCEEESGAPCLYLGNVAVTFKVTRGSRCYALRCYLRPKPNIRQIYGKRWMAEELYLYGDDGTGQWVDVVLLPWYEGCTLAQTIARHGADRAIMRELSHTFERLAYHLLCREWAHGDITPSNIIVDERGQMHLIDLDAMWSPTFDKGSHDEMGTRAFSHPQRKQHHDKHIDDYGIALIATALAAMSVDDTLAERYGHGEALLIEPTEAVRGRSEALEAIERLFIARGMARHYRLAQLLRSRSYRLVGLERLLETPRGRYSGVARLIECEGLWGYADAEGATIIPPCYDEAFDFSEGCAAVRISTTWHYIDTQGVPLLSFADIDFAKPFVEGRAELVRGENRQYIDHSGRYL